MKVSKYSNCSPRTRFHRLIFSPPTAWRNLLISQLLRISMERFTRLDGNKLKNFAQSCGPSSSAEGSPNRHRHDMVSVVNNVKSRREPMGSRSLTKLPMVTERVVRLFI